MADVVHESQRLGQVYVQAERCGEGAGDLSYLKRVREAAAEVVAGFTSGRLREDLCFAGKAAKGAGVEDARVIAGKWGAIRMWLLGVRATSQFAISGD